VTSQKDSTKSKGEVTLTLRGPDGKVKQVKKANTVTTAGKAVLADRLLASPTLVTPGWVAVGTGTPSATLLGAEIARIALVTKTRSTNVLTMTASFAAGTGTGALTEAGIFNVVTANTVDMHLSATFSVINKGASDTLDVSWTWTMA
jgi:hypothetical protein